jgi:4-diphosphocytidyl-2-C-methyl-D-erythritol kinase
MALHRGLTAGKSVIELQSVKNSESLELRAFAKINLYLEVLGRRADGYHDIRTVMVPVELYDSLRFSKSTSNKIEIEVKGASVQIALEDNLVNKAGLALADEFKLKDRGAEVLLEKRIPLGAGLGGGSADASAAVEGFARLWKLNPTAAQKHRLATGLGSDVPFFLTGNAALATGRGEFLTRVPAKAFWVVIAQPSGVAVSTAWAYGHALADRTSAPAGRMASLLDALAAGDAGKLAKLVHNDFLMGVEKHHPEIKDLRTVMMDCGALAAMLSGSGSAVYAICNDETHATEVGNKIAHAGIRNWVVSAGVNCDV